MATVLGRPSTALDTTAFFDDPVRLLALVQQRLHTAVVTDAADEHGPLAAASRSALVAGGKRVRPVLAMLACAHVGAAAEDALDFGCAVEMVHAASLVMDDLPCMDDAAWRRGAPTVHRAHGEDAAMLAAIALLNEAHRLILTASRLDAVRKLALADELTAAVGFNGLAQGQMHDLRDDHELRTEGALRRLNHLKTGALFVAALRGGGVAGSGSEGEIDRLSTFGRKIGFAFQLCDDLRDVLSTRDQAGKDVGQDQGKRTLVDLWGVDRAMTEIRQAVAEAEALVGPESGLSSYVRGLFRNAGLPC